MNSKALRCLPMAYLESLRKGCRTTLHVAARLYARARHLVFSLAGIVDDAGCFESVWKVMKFVKLEMGLEFSAGFSRNISCSIHHMPMLSKPSSNLETKP